MPSTPSSLYVPPPAETQTFDRVLNEFFSKSLDPDTDPNFVVTALGFICLATIQDPQLRPTRIECAICYAVYTHRMELCAAIRSRHPEIGFNFPPLLGASPFPNLPPADR